MIKKHEGHVCYCDRVDGEYLPTAAPSDESVEFYVDSTGTSLWRRSVLVTGTDVVCKTGIWNIKDFCAAKNCEVPVATIRLLQQESIVAQSDSRQTPTTLKKGKCMKNENGKSVLEVWSDLFVENEKRKEKWTDEQLADAFSKHFPNVKNPRPSMHRSAYNAGSYGFAKLGGDPKARGLLVSKRYDEKGREIPFGKHKAVVDNETGDPDRIPLSRAMKEQAAKKKVTKKVTKAKK